MSVPRKIVITGGPGSGKTVITQRVAQLDPRFIAVPEAATQFYTMLQTRWDRLDLAGRHDAQRRMYDLQREQESRISAAHPDKILLLDRGTVDGAAYWPEGPEAFWRDRNTTHAAEVARYDAVFLLETAATIGLYDGDASNAVRFETGDAAIAAGNLLRELWSGHPQLHFIAAYEKFEEKIAAVRNVLELIIAPA